MLKPLLFTLAHVAILSVSVLYAKSNPEKQTHAYAVSVKENSVQPVQAFVSKQHPVEVSCQYAKGVAGIPAYMQFSCQGASSLLGVTIQVADGNQLLSFTKEVMVNEADDLYEIDLTALSGAGMKKNKDAQIMSVTFKNLVNGSEVAMQDVSFSNASSFVEIKMGQVVSFDAAAVARKNYYIQSSKDNLVNISLAKTGGNFNQCITGNIFPGQNVLSLDALELEQGTYTIVITEAKHNNLSHNATVMN